MIDIRLPIGLMFSILGLLLCLYGMATASDTALYLRSMGYNINLLCGLLMLAFGGFMLLAALRRRRKKAS